MTEYEETDYANPVGRRGGLAKAQSFGDDPDQIRKEELLELLHRIAPNASRRNAGSATARNGAPDARVASAWSSDGTDAIAAGTREMPE